MGLSSRNREKWLASELHRTLIAFNDALICLSYPALDGREEGKSSWMVTLHPLSLIGRRLYF